MQWNEEVLPLMAQAGLRAPFPPAPTRDTAGSAALTDDPLQNHPATR